MNRRTRTQRATSNVFAMFSQDQIQVGSYKSVTFNSNLIHAQEFKEAFNMIDQNHDGFLCRQDLLDMFHSLGMFETISNHNNDEIAI